MLTYYYYCLILLFIAVHVVFTFVNHVFILIAQRKRDDEATESDEEDTQDSPAEDDDTVVRKPTPKKKDAPKDKAKVSCAVPERLQFVTGHTYNLVDDSQSKWATVKVTDPEPEVPTDFDLFECKQGEYLVVKGEDLTLVSKKKNRITFPADQHTMLNTDWTPFDDDMTPEDLKGSDEFLLYYQYFATPPNRHGAPNDRGSASNVGKGRSTKR